MKIISTARSHGGVQGVYSHASDACWLRHDVSRFSCRRRPREAPCPVVWYLSGLTCTHANVMDKGEYRRTAAELGLIIVCPDTSPRGAGHSRREGQLAIRLRRRFLPRCDRKPPYAKNYRMYSYVTEELPALIAQ
jgi:S-formylglutathione hydrolase